MRHTVGLGLIAYALLPAAQLAAQEPSAAGGTREVAAVTQDRYVPLQAVREGRVGMPAALRRRVTVQRQSVPLQNVLLEIANQAGLGLSYSDEVARSSTRVSVEIVRATAADALAQAVQGTPWSVLVTPQAQVTVVPASRRVGAIVGQVTDSATGRGLKDARVSLEGTQWYATTDSTGYYRLSDVDAGVYTLVALRLGYAKRRRQITIDGAQADTVNVALAAVAVKLDELITTATGQQRRRDIGNAITTIRADSVLRTAPIRNLTDLLEDRVPGLTVRHTSGAPGDPARLRLRGLGSVFRSNDPVVIVDGMRIYAAQSAARSGNMTNRIPAMNAEGQQVRPSAPNLPAPSPLDQIDPNIIEKIEVFKGPSAATLYGADAANGVIVITTKKGKPGPTEWRASFAHGQTGTLGRYPTGYYFWGHDSLDGRRFFCANSSAARCVRDSLAEFQALNVPSLTVLGQGRLNTVSLAASGGSQALTYRVTGSYGSETGLLKLPAFEVERFRTTFNREAPDWMRRPHQLTSWSVTSNVRAVLGPTADVTLSASLNRAQQQRTSLEQQVAELAGTYVDSVNKVYYKSGVESGGTIAPSTAILRDYYIRTTASSLNFTTGVSANWRPRSWLTAAGQASINIVPRNDQSLLPAGLATPTDSGSFSRATGQSLVSTFDLRGTVRRPLRWGFVFETNLGANLNTESTADIGAAASGLLPGTSTITGAARVTAFDAQTSNSVFGWYVEPRISGQRLSLSTGLRLDGGSAYGTRLSGLGSLLALPKLNGSWVISEEPWFPFNSLFSSLRLRGAYGQAQVQPGPADRLRLYRYSGTADPSVELTTLGNTQLRPERSTEFEGGFEADLLESRVSLEFTGYRKTRVDALMPLTLPTSVGGGGSVLTNIGTIRNTGVELVLRTAPLRSPSLTWSNELSYSSNYNELVELGRGVAANRKQGLVAGYPVGGRWDRPILGYSDQNGNGRLELSEILVGDSAVFMGRLYPAYQMTLQSAVSLFNGAVAVSAGLSYDAGATQLDQTAKTNWVLSRALVDPSTPLQQQAAVLTSISDQFDTQTDYGVIQNVSTLRFKSFSVNYTAPASVARLVRAERLAIAFQGDNLALHSTYRGKDPDVNAWAPGEGVVDGGQLARPRTWQLRVDLKY